MSRIAEKLKSQHLKNAGWKVTGPLIEAEIEQGLVAGKITRDDWVKPANPKAYCAWEVHGGVNVAINNPARVSLYPTGATIELSVEEAFALAKDLITAAYATMALDRDYANDMAKEMDEKLKSYGDTAPLTEDF